MNTEKIPEILLSLCVGLIPCIMILGFGWMMIKMYFLDDYLSQKKLDKGIDSLEKLKALHENGMIDDEAFEKIRKTIIVSLTS